MEWGFKRLRLFNDRLLKIDCGLAEKAPIDRSTGSKGDRSC